MAADERRATRINGLAFAMRLSHWFLSEVKSCGVAEAARWLFFCAPPPWLEPADQQFAFIDYFGRKVIVEFDK